MLKRKGTGLSGDLSSVLFLRINKVPGHRENVLPIMREQ